MEKLVVNLDEITNYCSKYLEEIDTLIQKNKNVKEEDLQTGVNEIDNKLKPFIEDGKKSVKKVVNKSNNFFEKVDECCNKYLENENDTTSIDIGATIDVIKSEPEYITSYKSTSINSKIPLKSYDLYNPWGYNSETHEYDKDACLLPIDGITEDNVTSWFGPRSSPGGIGSTDHKGIDIGMASGTEIRTTMTGTVEYAGYYGGYGNCVIVSNGNTKTLYAHMLDGSIAVSAGDQISAGTKVGQVGSTGNSTGPHLHYEIQKDGVAVDPAPYMGFSKE